MNGPTAKQIHERILLIAATIGFVCAANLTWWGFDTRVYSGWSQVASDSSGLATSWERFVWLIGVVFNLVLIFATLWRPDLISTRLATTFGLVAAARSVSLLVMAAYTDGPYDFEVHGGLLVAVLLAGAVSFLWMSFANDPWPKPDQPVTENPFELDPRLWVREFARCVPEQRPLTVLDLGSGRGEFTPALAAEFGGDVYGVEPIATQRQIAALVAAHARVTYLEGSADVIPLPDQTCDLAVLIDPFEQFGVERFSLEEVARVLRRGGVVLIRSQFAEHLPELHWYRYFPSARQVDADLHPSLGRVRELAARAGLVVLPEPVLVSADVPRDLRASYDQLRRRSPAALKKLSADEREAGFAEFKRDVTIDPSREIPPATLPLLVLRRP
ncbi:MAG TPA: class I SAM-dependent methyltransferase [Kribbella sp.]